jgi:mannose-6-phosphate isomerase-like protein (cupin superfamily)
VAYKPVRPAFTAPTLIRREDAALQLWGDEESGQVADAIYISNEKIHLMIFTMAPGGGFTHSGEFRTVFDADELYYVLDGELVMSNPETGEVYVAAPGEAVFFRGDTWHHGFTRGLEPVRVLEFIAPGPLSGNTQGYARTKPNLTEDKRVAEEWLGRWPMEREAARAAATMQVVGDRDVLWELHGEERVLTGIRVSTERMTVATVHLHPGQRSDVHAHEGDELVFMLEGDAGVRLPEHESKTWFELGPEDGLYIPAGTPHRYQSFSGKSATLFVIVGPSDAPPTV